MTIIHLGVKVNMRSIKKYLIIILAVFALLFIFQNTESTVVSFLFYELSMPRALLLSIVLAIGIIIGVFLPFEVKKNKVN